MRWHEFIDFLKESLTRRTIPFIVVVLLISAISFGPVATVLGLLFILVFCWIFSIAVINDDY